MKVMQYAYNKKIIMLFLGMQKDRAVTSGFLLIEMLVALVIFAVITATIAAYQVKIVYNYRDAYKRHQAVMLAHDALEQAKRTQQCTNKQTVDDITVVVRPRSSQPTHITLPMPYGVRFSSFTMLEAVASWRTAQGTEATCRLLTGFLALPKGV